MTDTIEEQRALAEKTFPDEWKASFLLKGPRAKHRRKALREAAIYMRDVRPKVDAMRREGKCCGNCSRLIEKNNKNFCDDDGWLLPVSKMHLCQLHRSK